MQPASRRSGGAAAELLAGLVLQPLAGGLTDARRLERLGVGVGELREGGDANRDQSDAVVAAHAGDEAEVVAGAQLVGAAGLPGAGIAVGDGHRAGGWDG